MPSGGRIKLVPLAGIEPALLAELDFESSASTNSATGASRDECREANVAKPAEYSGRRVPVNPRAGGLKGPAGALLRRWSGRPVSGGRAQIGAFYRPLR